LLPSPDNKDSLPSGRPQNSGRLAAPVGLSLMGAPSIILGFLGRAVGSVLVVAFLLLAVAPASDALVTTLSSLWRWPEVRARLEEVAKDISRQADDADARFDQLSRGPSNVIDARLGKLDARLAELSRAPRLASTSYLDLAQALVQGQLEMALKAEVERRILLQERDALLRLYVHALAAAGRSALVQDEAKKRDRSQEAHQREAAAAARVRKLKARVWCSLPASDCASELSEALREWREAYDDAWRKYRDWEAASEALKRGPLVGPPPSIRTDRVSVQGVFDDMSRAVARVASWHGAAAQPIWNALLGAVQIVGFGFAMFVAFKAVLYFVLARLAERRPPLLVREGQKPVTAGKASRSALSLQFILSPEQELVALGSHLQSVADGASTGTKWLLSAAHPLTSLLSGLWMLTRLQPRVPCAIVLSGTTDALEELNAVTLDEGDALVLLPKHLVGVIHPAGRHVRLRSHWKVSTHTVLTLQFRYLVFEGPCTLIVGGCRGVRVEPADDGRSVNQAMTVGFSPHLAYTVARTETFTAYLLGQRPLFNDRFRGPGLVVYQEVPSTAQRVGFTGRGLQGMLDGAMRAFGL
jgi:hypothetical protein